MFDGQWKEYFSIVQYFTFCIVLFAKNTNYIFFPSYHLKCYFCYMYVIRLFSYKSLFCYERIIFSDVHLRKMNYSFSYFTSMSMSTFLLILMSVFEGFVVLMIGTFLVFFKVYFEFCPTVKIILTRAPKYDLAVRQCASW